MPETGRSGFGLNLFYLFKYLHCGGARAGQCKAKQLLVLYAITCISTDLDCISYKLSDLIYDY